MRLTNSVVVANGKGGVGKTTVTANLASEAARRGAGALVVDLDPQANLAREFGITDHDQGKSLVGAAMGFLDAPTVYSTGRDRLRLICGGEELLKLQTAAIVEHHGNPVGLAKELAAPLRAVAKPGDWIFIDTPPASGNPLSDAALLVGKHLLIPTREDINSLEGVGVVLKRILDLAETSGDMIDPIGVVQFAYDRSAKKVNARASQWLEDNLHGVMPVLESVIRKTTKAQADAKDSGLVAAEYAELASSTELLPWYKAKELGREQPSFAKNADDIAADYTDLANEITRLVTRAASR